MAETSDAVGDLRLETVVINVQDMRRAVDFWTATLGVRAAFGVLAGQQVLPGAAGEYVRELPGQVVGIT
jgi:catechol 2,3-dioxygenase-like lactoylglutathione lyase family enzyme